MYIVPGDVLVLRKLPMFLGAFLLGGGGFVKHKVCRGIVIASMLEAWLLIIEGRWPKKKPSI